MAKYILLRVNDDREADALLWGLAVDPTCPLLALGGVGVHAEVVPGLDAGDAERQFGADDPHGLSLETAIGWAYERGPQLAAEWETSA